MSPNRRDFFAILAGGAASLAVAPKVSADAHHGPANFRLTVTHPRMSYTTPAGHRVPVHHRGLTLHSDVDGIWEVGIVNYEMDEAPFYFTHIYINDPAVKQFLDDIAAMLIDPPGHHRSYPAGRGLPAPYSDWYDDASRES